MNCSTKWVENFHPWPQPLPRRHRLNQNLLQLSYFHHRNWLDFSLGQKLNLKFHRKLELVHVLHQNQYMSGFLYI